MTTQRVAWFALARAILRYRLHLMLPHTAISVWYLRWLLAGLQHITPTPKTGHGERLCAALLELGPVYIKLGQLLSTRKDLFADDITTALAKLQDRVPPIPGFDVHGFVSETLGESAEYEFDIEQEPLASASIAQVHRATARDGSRVVLKIVRPGLRERIEGDMHFLARCGDWIDRRIQGASRLHIPRILRDHRNVLLMELNMFHEARNQIQLRRNFADSDLLYVPRVYPQWTRENLLVMEFVDGIPIGNVAALNGQGVDLKVLAHKGVATFFTQVFEHNFFHADMHPGNILIDVRTPTNPRYIALDCAIIGVLEPTDQQYLAENLVAFFNRDYARVAELHLASGWVPADTDAVEFERVIGEVCDPIFNKPLAQISFADFIVTLFQTAGRFEMEIQPQLALLQKTLLYVEGLGRQLYPELDLWQTAQPFMERWVAERNNPLANLTRWLEQPDRIYNLLAIPASVERNQQGIRELQRTGTIQQRALVRIEQHLSAQSRSQRIKRIAGLGLITASIYLLWPTLTASAASGNTALLAGIASIVLGSTLIMRA